MFYFLTYILIISTNNQTYHNVVLMAYDVSGEIISANILLDYHELSGVSYVGSLV